MARRLIATGTTGTDGSCIIPFIGTGAGKVDLEVETEISGEVITKNISVIDTLLYDTGTDPTHEIWTGHTEELTRGEEYSTLRESSSPNPTNIDTVMPVGPWVLTMDIKRDGHFTNWDINILNNNVSVFGCATPTNDVWTSITLIYDGSKIDYYENGTTLVKSVDVVLNVDKDTVLRLQTPQDITYLDFKDLMVVREGSSSIVCGASKDIIQSGESTAVTARLYENGVIVKNTYLEVYQDGTKVGTVNTGSTGVASYSYTGAGVGEVEFYFKKGSIVSETFTVWDTLFYDKATNGTGEKNTNWNESNATAIPTSDGTVLSNSSDTFGYYRTTQTFNSPIAIEFDIVYSGTCGIDLNASGAHRMVFSDLGVVTDKSIKLVYDGETIKCYIDGSSTPSKTFTPSESYSNFKFGFYIRNSSSTLTYKNLKIYPA